MKGVIVKCLKEMIEEKYGRVAWENGLKNVGVDPNTLFLPTDDYPDETVLKVVNALCSNLNLSLIEMADLFGDYFINVFAPKVYSAYFIGVESAREFLLKMSKTHQMATNNLKNAHPPRFDFVWKDEKTAIMK